jgi:acetyltransferase-like isoleucine patch superfamily enzyme
VQQFWARNCLRLAGRSYFGRIAYALAAWAMPPYKGARALTTLSAKAYIAFSAKLHGANIQLARQSFVGDGVVLYQGDDGGDISIGKRSSINQACILETGQAGRIDIGEATHIQPRCQFSAYKGNIIIGKGVQIAPNCSFYSYNHGFSLDQPIMKQPLSSKGGIVIEDDVWLSVGVVVLDGVTIGKGAVIGAGAVVSKDIPAGAIAAGIPAKVISYREGSAAK